MTAAAVAAEPTAAPATTAFSRRRWVVALLVVWVLSAWYVFHSLPGNWVASDDGMLAQSAERILQGQMPHRDFAEVYTGGLSYLHAAAFKLFGVRLLSLRFALFALFLIWLPAVFYCASRFVGWLGTSVVTLLSVVWTVPNYPASMPSWYNLYFATFGAAALLHYSKTGRRRWLVAAGAAGGLSMLIKITGLYYIAACLLYLVVRAAGEPLPGEHGGRTAYRAVVTAGLALIVAGLVGLLRYHLTLVHVYHFLVPGTAIVALGWYAAVRHGRSPSLGGLWGIVWPLLFGVSLPIAAFALPYAARGALPALVGGVFVSPSTRLAAVTAAQPPPGWVAILPAVMLAGIILLGVRAGDGIRGRLVAMLWLAVAGGTLAVGGWDYLDLFSWAAVAQATPLLIVSGVVALRHRWAVESLDRGLRERCFLLLALAALCSLTAFPYSAPIYFCYTAPLVLLALVAVLGLVGGPPRPLAGVLAGFYLTLALLALNAQSVRDVGIVMHPALKLVPLRLPRTGIRVRVEDAERYVPLVDTLVAHARGGVTYAGPDAPELYFLAGLRNPTRWIFDFLEPGARKPDSLLALIDRERITAVVIRSRPEFSQPLEPSVLQGLAERFPRSWSDSGFMVRWRD